MKKFQQLLISCIDEEITGTTIERLVKVKEIFEAEMLYEKYMLNDASMQKKLQDWLQGLCSTVSIPFENYAIIEWYESQLERKAKEHKGNKGISEADKWTEKYWPQCARTLYRMLYA